MVKIKTILILTALVLWLMVATWPDDRLHLYFCDVGQGDGAVIALGFTQIVIDGGPNDKILDCLKEAMPFWDRKIEMLIMTHPQADHMTGFIALVNRYEVGQLAAPLIVNDISQFWQFREMVIAKNIPVRELLAGGKLKINDLIIKTIWPYEPGGNILAYREGGSKDQVLGDKAVGDPNLFSSVLLGSFGSFDFLFTGDIDTKIEAKIAGEVGEIEVLKVAHHGSKYSSSDTFLQTVSPEAAVISVGKNNFGHPTAEALGRLGAVGAAIYRTDREGLVHIVSDGQKWYKIN